MELWTITKTTIKLHKEFYDLPLHLKYYYILQLPEEVLLNPVSFDRIVLSIVQHSSPEAKKTWPIQRERKLSRTAKIGDVEHKEIKKEGLHTVG